ETRRAQLPRELGLEEVRRLLRCVDAAACQQTGELRCHAELAAERRFDLRARRPQNPPCCAQPLAPHHGTVDSSLGYFLAAAVFAGGAFAGAERAVAGDPAEGRLPLTKPSRTRTMALATYTVE